MSTRKPVNCAECNGTGVCPNCRGSGQSSQLDLLNPHNKVRTCPLCSGRRKCPTCQGKGIVYLDS